MGMMFQWTLKLSRLPHPVTDSRAGRNSDSGEHHIWKYQQS